MSVQQMRVILDDNAGVIKYGSDWDINDQVMWYQGSTNFPSFTRQGPCSFSLAFQGTSIAFIGNTPSPTSSQTATFTLDGASSYNSSYDSPPGQQSYVQWYQSPLMSDGAHTIQVSNLDGTAIDMAIMTVGPNTPLGNNSIFVDNDDPSISYSGSWTLDQSTFHAGNVPSGSPVGNTTQTSNTAGDAMSFSFAGSSISVYGIFQWAKIGSISAVYTLDGVPSSQTYLVTADSPQHSENDATNYVFYSKNNLSPGPHTLGIQITDIVNQTYKLDYMVYSPSFSSFAEMPDLSAVSTTAAPATQTIGQVSATSSSTSLTTPSGFSTVFGTAQTTAHTSTSASASASASGTASVHDQAAAKLGKSAIPVGAIVGLIVGIVLIMSLLLVLLVRLRRRRQEREQWASEPAPSMSDQSAFMDGKA
ncbi:hypothetical protein HYPSUDRAFT_67446 [Hypholoma sublateritium FD-334 SS-4]|uniref:Mid2 domain-containing protein n=1 Tax=Hypholoma sublateritium (strain FD-334 SS-4) TaxID=945553 RepID=A0A0D2MDY9_HYPSF|nr:hypothetical protein HYPSUDRAFT_67446 [Hypholoma sublateritium FD-334 SS-4]